MNASIRLVIRDENDFFGPGTYELFKAIEREGSVLNAAQSISLSYSKARRMLKNFYIETHEEAVLSQHGGLNGGSAVLTDYALEFLKKYELLLEKSKYFVEQEFKVIYEKE